MGSEPGCRAGRGVGAMKSGERYLLGAGIFLMPGSH